MLRKPNLGIVTFTLVAMLAIDVPLASAAETLDPSDFRLQSWSKTIDFYDHVRVYASRYNMTPLPDDWHAYLYLTYVNVSGMQMLYAGLSNITEKQILTIPIQTFMMHYKSKDGFKDVVTASSFMMLLAFSEDGNTIFPQSPDRNDTLYASFSLGVDLSEHFGSSTTPSFGSKTEIIPLTSYQDDLRWYWGMKYTDLTAIWWRISINPHNPTCEPRPIAISRYEELTFTYNLTINPETGNATLSTNYIVGKMTDLWIFRWLRFVPLLAHYNATGCYSLRGTNKLSDETIHSFLESQGIKISIVQFQSTVVLDHTAHFSSSGANVTDNEVVIDNSTVSTFTDDGERIFDADFSTKRAYKLFNYTDPTETDFTTHNITTRTCKRAGFAHNPIFNVHSLLMRFIPLVVAYMNPELYQQARNRLLDMNRADYFYVISYPTYGGYRIEHDPTYTAYCSLKTEEHYTQSGESLALPQGRLMFIAGLAGIAAVLYIIMRRRH